MENKVVLVTGSTRGIGKATIIEFASKGYNVVINYVSSEKEANELKAFVEEEKLEFVCEVEKVKNVIQELRKSHPYEEPAIDIIPLIDESEFK